MNAPIPDIDAVILAGGRGRRLGGEDKGLLLLAGRPLVSWVTACLVPQVGDLVISANRNLDAYAALGYRVVPDLERDFPGPLGGVMAGSRQLARDWLLIVPCDTPFLPRDLARRLREVAREQGAPLVRAADGERIHGAVFLMHRRLLPDLFAYLASGGRRVQDWQARHHPAEALFALPPHAFLNINSAAELRQAETLADLC